MFADELDKAAFIAEVEREEAAAAARLKAQPEQIQNPDGSWPVTECVDCGDDIEPGRLAMGKVRCFTCQNVKEKKAKLYA